MAEAVKNIVIDCDTGIDDALALLMAMKQESWNILGITAVAGNVPLEYTAKNCVRICTLAGKRIPVYAGAEKPLYREPHHAALVHGENGLGGVELPLGYEVEEESALSFLTRTAAALRDSGGFELITLGPLTNIALALKTDPSFAASVKRLTLMGGAVQGGNAAASAEFNILADAEAAKIVFQSGIPLTMIGLDVTNRTLLGEDVINRWQQDAHPVVKAAGSILHGYRKFLDGIGVSGVALHDPLAVGVVIDPEFVTTESLFVDIETKSSLSYGRTVGDLLHVTGKSPNTEVALEVDHERFVHYFIHTLESYRS